MVQFAPLYNIILDDVNVDLRATFDSADKLGLEGPGQAFQRVVYKVKVKSPSPEAEVRRLLEHAERGCHAAQSLRAPVQVDFEASIISTAG